MLVIDTGVSVDGGAAANGQRWDVALMGATARVGDRDIVLSPLRLDIRVDLANDAPSAPITLSVFIGDGAGRRPGRPGRRGVAGQVRCRRSRGRRATMPQQPKASWASVYM